MVNDSLMAIAFAVGCWWMGTGIILWLDRLATHHLRHSLVVGSLLFGLSFWGVHTSMQTLSTGYAYLGFGSVIVMWGWHELAFLSGWLSGPRREPMSENAQGWQRWREAVASILWHELALLANFAVLVWMQQGQSNHVALCTFALLWCMRLSAKLNLFWGVPLHGADYLPPHLRYLASYFRVARPGLWFYLSMTAASAVWAWLVWSAHAGHVEVNAGWLLLASLLGLALVEHLVMVLPWPLQKLWGWAMTKDGPTPTSSLTAPVPLAADAHPHRVLP